MLEAIGIIVPFLALFASPSVLGYAWSRRGTPRPGSFLARSSSFALHRLIIASILILPHILMLFMMISQPKNDEPPTPNHQYGPAYEDWLANLMMMAILSSLISLLAWVALFVVFVREMILAVRVMRARAKVLHEGTPTDAPPGTSFAIDFGVGEDTFAFHGTAGEGYREMKPALEWARGTPAVTRIYVAPVLTIVTALSIFGFIGVDLILSMGD